MRTEQMALYVNTQERTSRVVAVSTPNCLSFSSAGVQGQNVGLTSAPLSECPDSDDESAPWQLHQDLKYLQRR